MKQCSKCHIDKDLSDFRKQSSRPDGLQPACKLCAATSQNGSYAKYRTKTLDRSKKHQTVVREWVSAYKQISGCMLCDENNPVCLDLHHLVPGEKDFTVGDAAGRSLISIQREVEECVVLCYVVTVIKKCMPAFIGYHNKQWKNKQIGDCSALEKRRAGDPSLEGSTPSSSA